MNDQELTNAIAGGDGRAFGLLVDTYKQRVFNTVLGFVQHLENAEELTQDVFISVFENIGSFRKEAELSTWIYRISVNKSLDFLRKQRRKKRFAVITSLFGGEDESGHDPPDFDHPGVKFENKEKTAILFGAIRRLPENQQTAFLLQKLQGCTQAQIAGIMHMKEGAVESLLSRAKVNLKKMLTDYYSS